MSLIWMGMLCMTVEVYLHGAMSLNGIEKRQCGTFLIDFEYKMSTRML